MKNILYSLFVVLFCCVVSCGDDEEDLIFADVTMDYDTMYKIPNGSNLSWISENKSIAYIYNGNSIIASHVGTTVIRSPATSYSFNVTVKPTYTLYRDPYLHWGATRVAIKTYMSSASLYKETSDFLIYYGEDDSLIAYCFEDGTLSSVMLYFLVSSTPRNSILKHLRMRYVYNTHQDDDYYFVSTDKKNIITLGTTYIDGVSFYTVYYVRSSSVSVKSVD